MRTLIVTDKPNWAYASIADGLMKYNNTDMHLKALAIKGDLPKIKKTYKRYDRFLVMGWQCYEKVRFLPKPETLVGIHGHHAWDDHKTTPDKDVDPPQWLHDFLHQFRGVNCVSKRLHNLFPYSTYTPNGVDTELFTCTVPPGQHERVIVGCAYNPKHDWRKGVKEFIEPAAKAAGCELRLAPRNKARHEMPAYYNSIDVYVCASSSEGMSLSVLEALACGRIVISTWGEELCRHPVERTVDAITDDLLFWGGWKICHPRTSLAEKWSWKERAPAWLSFIAT